MELSEHAKTKLQGQVLTHHEMLNLLTERVNASTQTAVAEELGFSVSIINDVLHGRKHISNRLAGALGFRRASLFAPIVKRSKDEQTDDSVR